jgi:hypothetical protein
MKRGVDTAGGIIALVRIPEKQKEFLTPDEIWYREAVEAEFRNLLRPGSARMPERPTYAPPPQALAAENAIIQVLNELMTAPMEILHTPSVPKRRGPYRKRIPPEDFASETIAVVARHFGISVEVLITPGRGPIKGSGLPRWTAVYLLREGGMLMREIVDCLGYSDATPCYQALHTLAAMCAKDPILDRDISTLLEGMRAKMPGPQPDAAARPQSNAEPCERHADAPVCLDAAV